MPGHTLRPRYFVSRGHNHFVPLVATDELPAGMYLHGAPRLMSLESAGGMIFLGEQPRPSATYNISSLDEISKDTAQASLHESPAQVEKANDKAPDYNVSKTRGENLSKDSSPTGPPQHKKPKSQDNPSSMRLSQESQKQTRPKPASINTQLLVNNLAVINPEAAARHGYKYIQTPPSGIVPDESKKTHCTHWIRTGECDYTQKGCMYKHEMPPESDLPKFGFRGYPKWWKGHIQPVLKVPSEQAYQTRAQKKAESLAASKEHNLQSEEETEQPLHFKSEAAEPKPLNARGSEHKPSPSIKKRYSAGLSGSRSCSQALKAGDQPMPHASMAADVPSLIDLDEDQPTGNEHPQVRSVSSRVSPCDLVSGSDSEASCSSHSTEISLNTFNSCSAFRRGKFVTATERSLLGERDRAVNTGACELSSKLDRSLLPQVSFNIDGRNKELIYKKEGGLIAGKADLSSGMGLGLEFSKHACADSTSSRRLTANTTVSKKRKSSRKDKRV